MCCFTFPQSKNNTVASEKKYLIAGEQENKLDRPLIINK